MGPLSTETSTVQWEHQSSGGPSDLACASPEAPLESQARLCKALPARHPGSVPTLPGQGGRNGWRFL